MAGDDEIKQNNPEKPEPVESNSQDNLRAESSLTNSNSNDLIKAMRDSQSNNSQTQNMLPGLEIGGLFTKQDPSDNKFDKSKDLENPDLKGKKDVFGDEPSKKSAADRTELTQFSTSNSEQQKQAENIINSIGKNIGDNIKSSNKGLQSWAEGMLSLGEMVATAGTAAKGHTMHRFEWQDRPARNAVINPEAVALLNPDGTPQKDMPKANLVTPAMWEACHRDVNALKDGAGQKWGNCAEKAASACHEIMEQIRKNPAMAGCNVRQVWAEGKTHSWAEVKMPNGDIHVVDPWRGINGKKDDLKNDPYYGGPQVPSFWYGKDNSPVSTLPPAPKPPSHEEILQRDNRRQSLGRR